MFSRGTQRYERDSYNHWGLLSSSMARPANIRRNKHIEEGQQTTLCPRASRRAKSHRKSRPLNTSPQQRICIYLKIPAAEKRTQGRKEERKKTPHFSFSLFFLALLRSSLLENLYPNSGQHACKLRGERENHDLLHDLLLLNQEGTDDAILNTVCTAGSTICALDGFGRLGDLGVFARTEGGDLWNACQLLSFPQNSNPNILQSCSCGGVCGAWLTGCRKNASITTHSISHTQSPDPPIPPTSHKNSQPTKQRPSRHSHRQSPKNTDTDKPG